MPGSKQHTGPINLVLLHFLVAGSIAVTLFAGLFRHFVFDSSDPLRCGALLRQGQWLSNKFSNWQPEGCMLHPYDPKDISMCLSSRQVYFVGDSVTRQLFFTISHMADPGLPLGPPDDNKKHADHILTSNDGTEFLFIWDPYLNATRTAEILQLNDTNTSSTVGYFRKPALLVFGTGLWFLRYPESSGGLRRWEATVESTLRSIYSAHDDLADAVIFLPVQDVVPSKLSPARASTISNSDIDAMNSDLSYRIHPPTRVDLAPLDKSTGTSPPVVFPQAFNRMIHSSQTMDGLHYSESILKTQANVLLNYRCNEVLPKTFPFNKTCCRKYPFVSFHQLLILFFLTSWGPIGRWAGPHLSRRTRLRSMFPADDRVIPLSIFGFAVLLLFLADRTPIWSKEQKQYDPWVFGAWYFFSLIVGLLSMKRGDKDLGFLNREQTDEWKGWMQIAIVIYHYFGASKISGIYNLIRVLVAAYLFMSGYGHTTYYIKKADYSLLRVAQVMVRLNLLPICLAYVMDTNYLSYYFSPLVSMWFLIIYATMAVGRRFNDRTIFLIIKFFVSMVVVTVILGQAWILQSIFSWVEFLCGIRWSATEWAFRAKLDLWIVYFGMFSALAYIKFRELGLLDHPRWPLVQRVSLGVCGIILLWFFNFELSQPSKFAYNAWHPFVSFLPIGAFVILRNANAILRSSSSRIFAFIGRCSLETFIIQFHFWMAADTKGILLVIPGTYWRPLNMLISTIMFIWLSHKVAGATVELTNWFCGIPKKTLPAVALNIAPLDTSRPEEISLTEGVKDNTPDFQAPDVASGQRWVDRLASGSGATPGYRIFDEDSSWISGVGIRLVVTAVILWIFNVTWPS